MRVIGITSSSYYSADLSLSGHSLLSFGTTSSNTINYPAGTLEGDLVVAFFVSEAASAIALPSGWTSIFSSTASTATESGANTIATSGRLVASKVAGVETSVSVTLSGGGNAVLMSIRGFSSGYVSGSVLDGGTSASTIAASALSHTNPGPSKAMQCYLACQDGTSTTATMTFTNVDSSNQSAATAQSTFMAYKILDPSASNTITGTVTSTLENGLWTIGLLVA